MTRRKSNQINPRTPPRWVYALLGGGAILFILIVLPLTLRLVKQPQEIRKEAAPTAVLSLSPASKTIEVSQIFEVQIRLNPGSDPATGTNYIRGGDISLNFDPTYLKVIDADPASSGTQITPGDIFGTTDYPDGHRWVAVNRVENNQILFSMNNAFESYQLAGEKIFAIIQFEAQETSGSTEVAFDPETKITAVGGESVAATQTSASFTIVPVPTSTPMPTLTPIPTSSPTPTVTLTPTPTGIPTSGPTSTPTPILCPSCPTLVSLTPVDRGDGKWMVKVEWNDVDYDRNGYYVFRVIWDEELGKWDTLNKIRACHTLQDDTDCVDTNAGQSYDPGMRVRYTVRPCNWLPPCQQPGLQCLSCPQNYQEIILP